MITGEDGVAAEKLVTCDQDRWDTGFTVGVLGEFRLSDNFAFRLAPTMYFGTRHLTFYNHTDKMDTGEAVTESQTLSRYMLHLQQALFLQHRVLTITVRILWRD